MSLALTTCIACLPPRTSSGSPDTPQISEAAALDAGQELLRGRCWSDAEWRVIWWAKRHSWVVWCTMEDDEAYAECSARVDARSGEVKLTRMCSSTSWD
jgi:hypothetical protein